MFRDKKRFGQDPTRVVRSSESTFEAPRRWRAPRRVFTCSWSDFFIADADPWRSDAWDVIHATPQHTYQILTKRPERVRERLPWVDEPWPNVWLIVSAEDQKHLDQRWSVLADLPVAVRGLSVEPLLGPIDMAATLKSERLSWVIVGGESGPHARPMDESWVRRLRDQCVEVGIPFFFKQWGGVFKKKAGRRLDDRTWDELPQLV